MFFDLFSGALASRVKRKDTLALKLSSRPCAPDRDRFIQERSNRDDQPPGQTGLTWQSREQWEAIRTQIGTALTRSRQMMSYFFVVCGFQAANSKCAFCEKEKKEIIP